MSRYAERTEVSSDRSRAEIERTLRRYGAVSFAYGWDAERASVMFDLDNRRIRFLLPMPDPKDPAFVLTAGYPETDGEIYWDRQNAVEQAEYARQETAKVGRGETHEVGLLVTIDEED